MTFQILVMSSNLRHGVYRVDDVQRDRIKSFLWPKTALRYDTQVRTINDVLDGIFSRTKKHLVASGILELDAVMHQSIYFLNR